jgi:hypothetical protein
LTWLNIRPWHQGNGGYGMWGPLALAIDTRLAVFSTTPRPSIFTSLSLRSPRPAQEQPLSFFAPSTVASKKIHVNSPPIKSHIYVVVNPGIGAQLWFRQRGPPCVDYFLLQAHLS